MNIKIEHRQTRDEAKRRVEGLIQTLKTEYGSDIKNLQEHWTGYNNQISGSAKGYSVSGTVEIKELAILIDLKIPFLLQVFSKKIRAVVDQHVKNALQ
jgi:putative polyhydroxyalkanoate system protein